MTYVDIGSVDSRGQLTERESLAFWAAPYRARRLVRGGDVVVPTVRTFLRAIAPSEDPVPGLVVSTGFEVAVPPTGEQRAIAEFLDRETARVDALVMRTLDLIQRLTELRTALISAAVTGKIDVRKEAG